MEHQKRPWLIQRKAGKKEKWNQEWMHHKEKTQTVNVNGLNTSIKRQRLSGWIKKKHSTIYCVNRHTLNIKT